ncbi:MAG: helix-turn-helix domain-containing protein [Deltaproteobacteria bacterium]|nr:helix-turn-helix domain-containing protein [Deltaproteobacteria bacterium]
MTAEEKLARQRPSALELAQALGNVSEACRPRGISRTQFYEYKRRFQTHRLEGLGNLPPIHKSHLSPHLLKRCSAFWNSVFGIQPGAVCA